MKRIQRSRVVILSLTITVGLALAYNWRLSHSPDLASSFKAEPLLHASRQYVMLQHRQGNTIPEKVTARQLATAGFLDQEYVHALGSTRLTIDLLQLTNLKPPLPHDTLIRADLADGDTLVVLGDGSVQNTPSR